MQLTEVYWYVHGFRYPGNLKCLGNPWVFLIRGYHLIIIHLRQTICNRKSKKQYVYLRDTCKHIHVFLNPIFKIVQVNIFSIIIFFGTFILIYSVNFTYERNLTSTFYHIASNLLFKLLPVKLNTL